MSLLELDRVSKRYGVGAGERTALDDVSLEVERGELVVIRGRRRSGRSTLLRIASGLESPDSGEVRFETRAVRPRRSEPRLCFCRRQFPAAGGPHVYDQVLISQLARGVRRSLAHARTVSALSRVGAAGYSHTRVAELRAGEALRVALARSLTRDPTLIVVDEPTIGTDPTEAETLLGLLRALADEEIAVLASTADATGLTGADRALSLDAARLRGNPGPAGATVVALPLSRAS